MRSWVVEQPRLCYKRRCSPDLEAAMARRWRDVESVATLDRNSRVGMSRRDLARRGAAVGAAALVGGAVVTRGAPAAAAGPPPRQGAKNFQFPPFLQYP